MMRSSLFPDCQINILYCIVYCIRQCCRIIFDCDITLFTPHHLHICAVLTGIKSKSEHAIHFVKKSLLTLRRKVFV